MLVPTQRTESPRFQYKVASSILTCLTTFSLKWRPWWRPYWHGRVELTALDSLFLSSRHISSRFVDVYNVNLQCTQTISRVVRTESSVLSRKEVKNLDSDAAIKEAWTLAESWPSWRWSNPPRNGKRKGGLPLSKIHPWISLYCSRVARSIGRHGAAAFRLLRAWRSPRVGRPPARCRPGHGLDRRFPAHDYR